MHVLFVLLLACVGGAVWGWWDFGRAKVQFRPAPFRGDPEYVPLLTDAQVADALSRCGNPLLRRA